MRNEEPTPPPTTTFIFMVNNNMEYGATMTVHATCM
jgi:hypothetical protein